MINFDKKKIGQFFSKIKKDRKNFLIFILGLSGVLLIFCSEVFDGENITTEKNDVIKNEIYISYKEELKRLIESVKGVGAVEVMLTYEGTTEHIYAKDISQKKETDENNIEEEHIILDKGNTEEGLLLKEKYPRVTGVAVVCEGGESSIVKSEITMLLKALFGLSSSCISISEMNN